VVVMGPGQSCPTGSSPFQQQEGQTLVMLGLSQASTPTLQVRSIDVVHRSEYEVNVLQPNWTLIGALLGGLFAMVVLVIGGLYYFRYKAWGDVGAYRRWKVSLPCFVRSNRFVLLQASGGCSGRVVGGQVEAGQDRRQERRGSQQGLARPGRQSRGACRQSICPNDGHIASSVGGHV
jgi:hypothetical protein